MLTMGCKRYYITFTAGQRCEIDRYEVSIEESMPGFGMTIDDNHNGPKSIECDESLEDAVMYSSPSFYR